MPRGRARSCYLRSWPPSPNAALSGETPPALGPRLGSFRPQSLTKSPRARRDRQHVPRRIRKAPAALGGGGGLAQTGLARTDVSCLPSSRLLSSGGPGRQREARAGSFQASPPAPVRAHSVLGGLQLLTCMRYSPMPLERIARGNGDPRASAALEKGGEPSGRRLYQVFKASEHNLDCKAEKDQQGSSVFKHLH